MVGGLSPKKVNYEQAKTLARDVDPAVRRALASRGDVGAEILYFLAEDSDPSVRQAVARNQSAPRQTDLLLANDVDHAVRGGLAEKIAAIAPGLAPDDSNKIRAQTYEALETLARDQIAEVRVLLAEALKDIVDAPADIIRTLAMDLEIAVSRPVLENSPVLTDADLIEIVRRQPTNGAVAAVARRALVSENLADAIIGTDDVEGIANLIGNTSAQIREEALDDLIARADNIELWHAPLVARPRLSAGAAARMAGFVAENLLQVLENRTDLDAKTMAVIRNAMKSRAGAMDMDRAHDASVDFLKVDPPIDFVGKLHKNDKLKTDVIIRALQSGDHSFVFAAIILRTDLPVGVVRRIFVEKNPKAIVALCLRSKFPGPLTVMVQQKMGKIAPSQILGDDKKGIGSLDADELNWQIEFYSDMAERGTY